MHDLRTFLITTIKTKINLRRESVPANHREENVSREELIQAIKECAEKLGHTPTMPELFQEFPGANRAVIQRCFGCYTSALRECGIQKGGKNDPVPMDALFLDWMDVLRKAGKFPSKGEYMQHSRYSLSPMQRKFRSWFDVPKEMQQYAISAGLEAEYAELTRNMELPKRKEKPVKLAWPPAGSASRAMHQHAVPILGGLPVYGAPLPLAGMAFAPTNESGVIYLFGLLAERLGITVTRMQTGFPDCEALRRVDEKQLQRLRIEFEFESRNFFKHGHNARECDLIVCWDHNWRECPIAVLELKSVVMGIAGR
jgi:hypothetical protein